MPSARRRHYRISLADAIEAHDRALQRGGARGILNLGLVESAIQRPYAGYYRSIQRKAAALVHSVATNHGFADGNKRTTLLLLGCSSIAAGIGWPARAALKLSKPSKTSSWK